ncbi:MAG: hypothetical protein GY806_01675 [Gammaproteobacteria bacterium]|nr:hypothetical protein [Gammaproteobacteria bacterium]
MSNIYAAPEAELSNNASGERVGGNIEDAIAGNIEISMTATMGDAWRKLKGFKTVCLLASLLYIALAIVANFISFPVIFGLVAIGADETSAGLIGSLLQMIISIAILPVIIGIHILGMRHAENKSTTSTAIFGYFNKIPGLFLCYFVMIILIMIGMALLVLPGIYLMIGYMFSMHLVVEKNMPAWRALETSRKALTRVWFRFFGLYLLIVVINLLAAIPLFIGLIWTIPWSVLTMSMVYTRLFGAEAHTLAD